MKSRLRDEMLSDELMRTAVPGGWWVKILNRFSHGTEFEYFYFDPKHEWSGKWDDTYCIQPPFDEVGQVHD